mgnify:CR=1 FL=1
MFGNLVNAVSILVGSLLGFSFERIILSEYRETIMSGLGIIAVIMGIGNVLESENLLLVIVSIVVGSLVGEIIGIDKKLNRFGDYIGSKFQKSEEDNFSKGFVTSSLIFCVGAMAIIGALESGLKGDHDMLYAKSIIDGVTAIILTSTLGIGVLFSAVSVFLYQGIIVLLAGYLKSFLIQAIIVELTAVGGVMIVGIGLNILDLKSIRIANMLPALFGPVLYFALIG